MTNFSRRSFLATLAAAPFARALGATKPRIVVVGAGAFGGWTALHLRRMGAEVLLLDAWGPGNPLSSSGGTTRVIRAIYGPDRIYTEMVKRAYELWGELNATQKDPLYFETGALWMHRSDDSYVRAALPILHDLGFPVEKLAIADAAKRYPAIDFDGVKSAYLEHKAGALYAHRACIAVRDAFDKEGGKYKQASMKPGRIAKGSMAALRAKDGSSIAGETYVFACGPWLGKLFPETIGKRVEPTRQEVYYFSTPKDSDKYVPAKLPIWIDFGKRIVYGIPDPEGKSLKVADDTRGADIDPTTQSRKPTKELIARTRGFLAERFPELTDAPLLRAEVCQYENSPDGNLIIDRHPTANNVWLLGGGSGHGFKLSPAVGELAAKAILEGKEVPEQFRLARLHEGEKHKTQFDTKS